MDVGRALSQSLGSFPVIAPQYSPWGPIYIFPEAEGLGRLGTHPGKMAPDGLLTGVQDVTWANSQESHAPKQLLYWQQSGKCRCSSKHSVGFTIVQMLPQVHLNALYLTFQAGTSIPVCWPCISFFALSQTLTWDAFLSESFAEMDKLQWKVSIQRADFLKDSQQVLYKSSDKSSCSLPPCPVTPANSKVYPWAWEEQL